MLFPPVCGFCGKLSPESLCAECEKQINKLKKNEIDTYDEGKNYFQNHMYIFKYEGIIREKIINYKFNDKAYLYKTFEKIILNDKKVCDFVKSYDIIIPVPIHRKRKLERGYNQSELIIKNIAKKLEIQIDNKSLIKVKNTQKQSVLNKSEREKNIIHSYELNKSGYYNLCNKNILILDDIFTTGSTLKECSKIVWKANPSKIDVFTFAKKF